MKLTNGSRRIRLGVALGAAAVAVAGSLAAVAAPAQAADELHHCVATMPESNERCFATYEEAKAFAASVAEFLPEKSPAVSAAARAAYGETTRASTQVFWPVVVMTAFDYENYNLPFHIFDWSYTLIGLNGPCTVSLGNTDYTKATLPSWVDNDTSSYLNYSVCWTEMYDSSNFGGSSRAYTGSSPTLGAWNNRASSFKFS